LGGFGNDRWPIANRHSTLREAFLDSSFCLVPSVEDGLGEPRDTRAGSAAQRGPCGTEKEQPGCPRAKSADLSPNCDAIVNNFTPKILAAFHPGI
jgi:hypothetical protein